MGKLRRGQRAGGCDECPVLMWQLSERQASGCNWSSGRGHKHSGNEIKTQTVNSSKHSQTHTKKVKGYMFNTYTTENRKKGHHINEFH